MYIYIYIYKCRYTAFNDISGNASYYKTCIYVV